MDELLAMASPALGRGPTTSLDSSQPLATSLSGLLSRRNGFYAFESALHVRASGETAGEPSLEEWNSLGLWRYAYGSRTEGHLFFAEDVFGGQFSIRGDFVWAFDPETGESAAMAASIEEWVDLILSDYEVQTGFPLAHAWQRRRGPISAGSRLVPKVPFVLGGEFTIANLYSLDATKSMLFRAGLATQIGDLPDGTPVRLDVVD